MITLTISVQNNINDTLHLLDFYEHLTQEQADKIADRHINEFKKGEYIDFMIEYRNE